MTGLSWSVHLLLIDRCSYSVNAEKLLFDPVPMDCERDLLFLYNRGHHLLR